MKIRKSFVTNSSSSSFICDSCGHDESGWDMCLSDAGMMECENGHTVCEDHVNSYDEREMVILMTIKEIKRSEEMSKKYDKDGKTYYADQVEEYKQELLNYQDDSKEDDFEWEDLLHDMEFRYGIPQQICPICNFSTLTDSDATAFMLYKYGVDIETLKKEIRENFSDYEEFKKGIKEGR